MYRIVHKASFLCVQHYSLHPNTVVTIGLYVCISEWKRDVRVGGCYCVGIVKLVSSVYSITLFTD